MTLRDNTQTLSFSTYSDLMFDYLEELGYPEYVEGYHPEDVAKSLHGATRICYEFGLSWRMAALINFGLTMTMQVMKYGVRH